ncbi:MAG TPA: DegT/DnrJ/EryC1/StrS family aminotransferase, partial [Fimbriimonas sp.]|nr:DegT/DnrJ/EryC1/StrS family aminotransferase [Fimbriimonas sp.]
MRVPFYDIKAQYDELAPQLDQVVHEVISGGSYVMGPHHNAFEKEVAELHGCKHGIGLNSGTDALRIMLDAAQIGRGDEVITTAFTFVASIEMIVQTGAKPVFVDIDPATYMLDVSKIKAAVTPNTKAIMPVHLFGQLCDVDALGKVSGELGIPVIEDAAQAINSHHNGSYAGNYGLAAGISYYVTKNLGAAGDAGMIITNDDTIAERCRSIRIHGMGRERYYYDYVGYTSRLDEVQAAVLRQKLTRLNAWDEQRAKWAAIYEAELSGIKDLHLPETLPGNNHTFHQYTVRS